MYLFLGDFATGPAYAEALPFSNFQSYIIADSFAFACAIADADTGEITSLLYSYVLKEVLIFSALEICFHATGPAIAEPFSYSNFQSCVVAVILAFTCANDAHSCEIFPFLVNIYQIIMFVLLAC